MQDYCYDKITVHIHESPHIWSCDQSSGVSILCVCLTAVRCSPEPFMLLVKIKRTLNQHMQHKIQCRSHELGHYFWWMNNKQRAIVIMFPGYECVWCLSVEKLESKKATEIKYTFQSLCRFKSECYSRNQRNWITTCITEFVTSLRNGPQYWTPLSTAIVISGKWSSFF